jgi:hypothetical protein
MSAAQLIVYIPVYQGAQGKFYEFDGHKYHPRFPVDWAMNHRKFQDGEYEIGTGPKECGNCNAYGSIRGVFVGYCSGCLEYYTHLDEDYRGNNYAPGLAVYMLENQDIWVQYPYMHGVKKSEIGDEEGTHLTDEGINLARLAEAMMSQEGNEEESMSSLHEISEIHDEANEDNNEMYDVSVIADDISSVNSGVDSLGNLSW